MPPFRGVRGNVHGSSMARWKARVDFLLVLIELFRQLSWLRRYEQILVEIVLFERRVGHLKGKSQGKGGRGSSSNKFWRHTTRVLGLSRGVVCVILCLAVLIHYRHV